MVGRASEGGLSASSLISLVPRQVMLEGCSVVAGGGGADLAEKKAKKRRKGEQAEKRSLPVARTALLRAIAAFLEGSGFTRTLAALRSEAQLEIDDGSKFPVLDLEEIICKYLESSKDPVVGIITGPEEQDVQTMILKKEECIHDHSEEPLCKKKKKKVKGSHENVEIESDKSVCENGEALPSQLVDKLLRGKVPEAKHETGENQLAECHMESRHQKRKKSKKVSNDTIESVGNEKLQTVDEEKSKESLSLPENASSLLDESNIRSKDKRKKKKNKLTSDSLCGVVNQVGLKTSEEEKGKFKGSERKTDGQMPTFATENATSENTIGEDSSKNKDKKRRKHKLIVESSTGYGAEVQNGSKSDGGKKGKSVSHGIEKDAKESDPKIEKFSSLANNGNIDKKAKKRKRSASEETELHVDDDAAVQESKQKEPEDLKEQKYKEEAQRFDDSLLNSELHTSGKKRKTETSEDNYKKSANMPVSKQSQVPKDAKEPPAAGIGMNEIKGQQEINGSLGKNEQEGNGSLIKHPTEPKTVKAFQRVKVDEVKFADERLKDNSYWAKDGAETGYGAKAQEILGQVRGRDFRHEKTKKKRGSYRGGQIDFQSHSVKFEYSDDDE